MRKYIVTTQAQNAINEILMGVVEYTGFEASAIALEGDLYAKFDLLAFMPNIGKQRADGTRETFCRGYRIVYDCIEDNLYIITVIHSRRLYPRP